MAGLIVNSTNSLVTNSTINFTAEINIQTTGDVYVGGVIANAHNANINDSNVAFTLNSSSDNMLLYVGGAIAYFEGNTAQTAGITKTEVTIAISNVKSVYVGGLVGFARYIKIAGCSTSGTYSKTGINYETYVGGLVGLAQSSIITMWVDENDQTNIKNSGSTISFNVAVSSIEEKYFGAIAGSLTVTSANVPCKLENCYMNLTYQEATSVTTSQITLGLYGYKDTAVIITGCHEL